MNNQYDNPVEEFKQRIKFDLTLQSIDENKSIVFREMIPESWKTLKGYNDKMTMNEVSISKKGISKLLAFKHENEMLVIEIFVASVSSKIAQERLLDDATATTMRVIPFKKCPYNLGDINVSIIRDGFHRILWTHYNVYYSVKYTGNNLDIEKLCRELQNDSTHFIVNDIDRYRPRFKEVIVSIDLYRPRFEEAIVPSNHMNKGDTVSITIVPAYGKAFTGQKKNSNVNISLEKIWNADILDLVDYTDFSFEFKGIAEGTETITFILADLDALVCSKHEVTITVTE